MDWFNGMTRVIEHIESNLSNPIQHELLAQVAGCTVQDFSRTFSFMTGMTVSEYIRRRRLSKAVYNIQNSNDKIIDIALKYCYESPTTFTRAFKELFGVSPIMARKTEMPIKTYLPFSFTTHTNMEDKKMAEIVKCYKQDIPATRFIGKKYGDADRVNGGFGKQWGNWHSNGWFDTLEQSLGNLENSYEDAGAYIAYMRYKKGGTFEYHIGMFLPESTPVPEGYTYFDIPASTLGVCWVKGREPDIYMFGDKCEKRLAKDGFSLKKHTDNAWHSIERYACPRYITPDENSNVILDVCYYIEP